jgi:transposase
MVAPIFACRGCARRDRDFRRLQQRLAELEKEVARLNRRCARLKKDNQRLRKELDEERRNGHRQAGPFRRRKLKKRKKKPGRPKGHPPELRPTPTPEQIDRIIHVPCRLCPDCHVELFDPGVVVQYQTDLPPIVPVVTQFNIETGWCPCCQRRHQGRHPQQTSDATGAAGNTLGPVVLTMAAELKHRLGVPYRKITDFLETYCDFKVSPAALVRAEQRLAERARPTYDLLIDALRRCGVVHADETGWRVAAVNAWLWVFTNQDLTIYTIRTGKGARGHGVPQEILGDDFDGYLIVDGFKAYEVLDYKKGQCNGHLLRRAKEAQEAPLSARQRDDVQELITLIQEAIDLAQRREQLTPEGYARRVQEIDNRLEDWLLDLYSRFESLPLEVKRLAKHVANHRDEWLVFLHDENVPATNNHAERMLRPAVITRKIGGCNKTLLGALVHTILASLMVTCRQQGQKFLDLARRLWSSSEPQAIPLVEMPPVCEGHPRDTRNPASAEGASPPAPTHRAAPMAMA